MIAAPASPPLNDLLDRLLRLDPAVPPIADVDAFWRGYEALPTSDPVARALFGGHAADRPAWAFAAGYQAALRALFPEASTPGPAAICVTEEGGNRPRDLRASLRRDGDGHRLDGHKKFVTLGMSARVLLVAAVEGIDEQGRSRVRVARVPADRAGISLVAGAALPFVPEVGHAELRLDNVRLEADELLPGDGYERYVKPFRTVEDLHVHLAMGAYLLRIARQNGWPREEQAELVCILSAAAALAREPAAAPAVHVALAGALAHLSSLLTRCEPHWQLTDEETRAVWRRDRALLQVAGRARAARAQSAWRALDRDADPRSSGTDQAAVTVVPAVSSASASTPTASRR